MSFDSLASPIPAPSKVTARPVLLFIVAFFASYYVISSMALSLYDFVLSAISEISYDPSIPPFIAPSSSFLRLFLSTFKVNPMEDPAFFIIDGLWLSNLYISYRIARSNAIERIYQKLFSLVGNAHNPDTNLAYSETLLGVPRLVVDIQVRLKRLQTRANLIIGIVVSSLLAAVVLIIFAGKLTSIDAAAVSNAKTMRDEVTSLDRQIMDLDTKAARTSSQQKAATAMQQTQAAFMQQTQAALQQTQTPPPLIGVARATNDADPEITIASLSEEKAFLLERRAAAAKLLNDAWKNEITETTQDKLKDSNFMTATFFTRIGVLVILVFLVQILISLYKYNMRMIAFYSSRLDSLRICAGDVGKLKEIIALLTPSTVDFGPDAKHPVQYIFDSFRRRTQTGAQSQSRRSRASIDKAMAAKSANRSQTQDSIGSNSKPPS